VVKNRFCEKSPPVVDRREIPVPSSPILDRRRSVRRDSLQKRKKETQTIDRSGSGDVNGEEQRAQDKALLQRLGPASGKPTLNKKCTLNNPFRCTGYSYRSENLRAGRKVQDFPSKRSKVGRNTQLSLSSFPSHLLESHRRSREGANVFSSLGRFSGSPSNLPKARPGKGTVRTRSNHPSSLWA